MTNFVSLPLASNPDSKVHVNRIAITYFIVADDGSSTAIFFADGSSVEAHGDQLSELLIQRH